MEEPGKFDLAINLRIAKALDLRIAEAFLIRADKSTDAADFHCWHLGDIRRQPVVSPVLGAKRTMCLCWLISTSDMEQSFTVAVRA